jgi:hypothetical protein
MKLSKGFFKEYTLEKSTLLLGAYYMKYTKKQLKQIIREELAAVTENRDYEGMSTDDRDIKLSPRQRRHAIELGYMDPGDPAATQASGAALYKKDHVEEALGNVMVEQPIDVEQLIEQGRSFFDQVIQLSMDSEDDPGAAQKLNQVKEALSREVDKDSHGYVKFTIRQ